MTDGLHGWRLAKSCFDQGTQDHPKSYMWHNQKNHESFLFLHALFGGNASQDATPLEPPAQKNDLLCASFRGRKNCLPFEGAPAPWDADPKDQLNCPRRVVVVAAVAVVVVVVVVVVVIVVSAWRRCHKKCRPRELSVSQPVIVVVVVLVVVVVVVVGPPSQ
ncbi:unnamed protein product [Polarella glacialis]|uniref:Uncharacterized protein n=1 Tax=Polarella glacialis TaxID=89957 RepID=A0A813K976_POLGL|nr:unnamed protein product [Polarella glacialis]